VDRTVKLWDLSTGRLTRSYETEGFAQSVQLSRGMSSSSLIFAADTRKNVYVLDPRSSTGAFVGSSSPATGTKAPSSALRLFNDAVVNSVRVAPTVSSQQTYVITGDHKGFIKVWDIRRP
jgi:WD40 repeat protein